MFEPFLIILYCCFKLLGPTNFICRYWPITDILVLAFTCKLFNMHEYETFFFPTKRNAGKKDAWGNL